MPTRIDDTANCGSLFCIFDLSFLETGWAVGFGFLGRERNVTTAWILFFFFFFFCVLVYCVGQYVSKLHITRCEIQSGGFGRKRRKYLIKVEEGT